MSGTLLEAIETICATLAKRARLGRAWRVTHVETILCEDGCTVRIECEVADDFVAASYMLAKATEETAFAHWRVTAQTWAAVESMADKTLLVSPKRPPADIWPRPAA